MSKAAAAASDIELDAMNADVVNDHHYQLPVDDCGQYDYADVTETPAKHVVSDTPHTGDTLAYHPIISSNGHNYFKSSLTTVVNY